MLSSSRNGAKVRVLAVHTTEGIMRAADLRAWTTWAGSSHASADETGVLMTPADGFVPYDRSAWTLRNGNPWSENIELCGFAKWKRPDWLARPKLLDACARWLAERSVARGIPLVKLTPKELAAGRSGVIGHHDYTVGYADGTHWDPGPDFPYDVVLARAAAYAGGTTPTPIEEPDLDADQNNRLTGAWVNSAAAAGSAAAAAQLAQETVNWIVDPNHGVLKQLGDVARAVAANRDDVDEAALASAVTASLVPAVVAALAGQGGLTKEQVRAATIAAVREVFADAAA